jgi:putative PIN family toxin of toxin-antitoxin system
MLRLVLDTNIWLDWLVFRDPSIAPVRTAVAAGQAQICIDAACHAELERVLAYPLGKRSLDAGARAACLAECRRIALVLEKTIGEEPRAVLPRCRDADDQKVLEAALAARAHCLITKDQALLELARPGKARALPFRILTPQLFTSAF